MVFVKEKVAAASAYLRKKGVRGATKGLFLDNGMGGFSNELSRLTVTPLNRIPHFPLHLSTRQRNALLSGELDGAAVVVLEGRGCLYEGYFHRELAVPLRVLAALGMKSILIVAHVTPLGREWAPGDLLLVKDHVDLTGGSPLRGLVPEEGLSFPMDMKDSHAPRIREKARELAAEKKRTLHEGVLALLPGPAGPTGAEERMFAAFGADAFTLSLGPEIVAARFLGLEVAVLGLCAKAGFPVSEDLETWGMDQVAYLRALLGAI